LKVASQEGLAPGDSTEERMANLKAYGYEGVEVGGRGMLEDRSKINEIKRASERAGIPISSICSGFRGCLLDADPAEREVAMEDIKDLLYIGGDLGAVGLIFVPLFGRPRISDLSPYASAVEMEKRLLVRLLEDLVKHAERAGCLLLLEPLNRYETHLPNRLEQAIEICQKVDSPHLRIMADFFHMSIEEADIAKSLRGAKGWVRHIHLADSNRILPGQGHTDFKTAFAALQAIGYQDFMALECGVYGDREAALRKSARYLRSCMPRAAATRSPRPGRAPKKKG